MVWTVLLGNHYWTTQSLGKHCSAWFELFNCWTCLVNFECSVWTVDWVMSSLSIQNQISVVTNEKYIIIPTISPFGISDKNTYEPKIIYKIWQNWLDSVVLYIHGYLTYNPPIQYTQGIYMNYMTLFTVSLSHFMYIYLTTITIFPKVSLSSPFWQ